MRLSSQAEGATNFDMRRFQELHEFAQGMDHFADTIRSSRALRTSREDGLQINDTSRRYQAAEGGGAVRMPLVAGLHTTRGQF